MQPVTSTFIWYLFTYYSLERQSNIERKEEESERQLEMRGGEWERMGEEREEEESEKEGEREREKGRDFAPADSFPGASNIGVNPNTEVIIYCLLGS